MPPPAAPIPGPDPMYAAGQAVFALTLLEQLLVDQPSLPGMPARDELHAALARAMTYFADLDISTLDELPPGRTPVVTKLFADDKREQVVARIRDEVGRVALGHPGRRQHPRVGGRAMGAKHPTPAVQPNSPQRRRRARPLRRRQARSPHRPD